MDVRTFPNVNRPGVGMAPRREAQRPLLPQHARHCPVLEAGSALGFLVYPSLHPNESFHIEYQGDGTYRLVFYLASPSGAWQPVFTFSLALPMGSIGMMKEVVEFLVKNPPMSKAEAIRLARAFIVPEDMATPPGAVALRAATNFQTPEGWDTVYVPVFNLIDRPMAPMMVVRVETDWYAHGTEFRYVLQPGEGIPGSHNMPVGQVFFVPREEVTLTECTGPEVADLERSMDEFYREKAKLTQNTSLGLTYSPHYARQSKARKSES